MKQWKGLLIGLLLGTVLTGGAVMAKKATQSIEVEYNNIKIYKDGVLYEAHDANGTVVEPFIYNGTTFMPVRATANMAGMQVTWDGATSSVLLWDKKLPDDTSIHDVVKPYDSHDYEEYTLSDDKSFSMAGVKYADGFVLTWNDGKALYNLNGKYTTMNFTLGHVDNTDNNERTVSIFLDGKLVKQYEVHPEDLPKTYTLPLNNALQMKIVSSGDRDYGDVGFGNVTIQ